MKHLSIRQKMSFPLVAACLVVLLFVVVSQLNANALKHQSTVISEQFVPSISGVLNADRDLYQARLALLKSVLNPEQRELGRQDYSENSEQAKDRMNSFNAMMREYPNVLAHTQEFDRRFTQWDEESLAIFDSLDRASFEATNKSFQALRVIYDKAGEAALSQAAALRLESEQTSARLSLFMNISAAVTLIYLASIS
ncbi:MAG TPA: hypothetical protein VIC26_07805, partial [Marinagarivorans sp.]